MSEKEQKMIYGGEICMWGEQTDSSNLDSNIWPRSAAAAEVKIRFPFSSIRENDGYALCAHKTYNASMFFYLGPMEWHKGHTRTCKAATRRFQAPERRPRDASPDGRQGCAHVPILVRQTPRSLSRGINPPSSLLPPHPQTNKQKEINAKLSIYYHI